MKGNVSIIIVNIIRQQIQKHDRFNQEAGAHAITIDLAGKPDGIYFISLVADGKTVSKIKAIKTN